MQLYLTSKYVVEKPYKFKIKLRFMYEMFTNRLQLKA